MNSLFSGTGERAERRWGEGREAEVVSSKKKKVGHTHTHKGGGVVEVEDLVALLGRERLRVGGDCLLKGQIPK